MPYAFPRDLATLASLASNRSIAVRYRPAALLRMAPWLARYWWNSAPNRLDKLGRAILPQGAPMKFINMYLIGYVILVIGIAMALWQSGILARVSGIWIVIGAIVAVGLGIMMSVSSGKPDITREG